MLLRALFTLLFIPSLVMAQDVDTSSKYSPEFCDFSITFPKAPYTARRCDDDDQNRCYNLVSYTEVFDMDTTVNFRVICNPIGPDIYKKYSGEVMEATLRAMTKKSVVKTFDTSFREEAEYKQAGLVGEGKVGLIPTIYLAQLWIGANSAFSVEAELIGATNENSDTLFSKVLRSVRFNGDEVVESPGEEKTDEPKAEPQTAP